MRKICFLLTGLLTLGLGTLGTILPILPTVPFLLVSAYCFARSSERLNQWFKSTKLYKDNLETYIQGQGMSKQAKMRIMTTVSILMSIGFAIMFTKGIYVPCIILITVWVFHIIYFLFGIKTLKV